MLLRSENNIHFLACSRFGLLLVKSNNKRSPFYFFVYEYPNFHMSMREFIAAMMSYQPGWVTFLYRIRAVFVRFLGMRQEWRLTIKGGKRLSRLPPLIVKKLVWRLAAKKAPYDSS